MSKVPLVGSLLAPIGHVWRALENIATLPEIGHEMRGLRQDMREVIAGIEGLRQDVRSLASGVGGIREATESLDAKIDGVSVHLENVSTLAGRLGRPADGRTRRHHRRLSLACLPARAIASPCNKNAETGEPAGKFRA